MLLGDVVLAVDVALQRGEDGSPRQEMLAALPLELGQGSVGRAVLVRRRDLRIGRAGDAEPLELLAQHDDRLLVEQRIVQVVRRIRRFAGRPIRPVEVDARALEEGEDELEALGVELRPSDPLVPTDPRTST